MKKLMFNNYSIIILLFAYLQKVSSQELYVGCYKYFPEFTLTSQSVSQCLSRCKNETYLFGAIKDGSSCYCGNNITTKVPTSNCNLPCKDNNGICGGKDFYAVYTAIPTYYGCFKDNEIRDITFENDWNNWNHGNTIESCYRKCLERNCKFMGVQFSNNCFCGQQYGKYGKRNEAECNMTCAGNGSQMCGGSYRNNVYSVGHIPALNKSYSEVFHCSNVVTMYGTCNTPTCLPGWKGSKCNYRDCSRNNGSCGLHQCKEFQVGNQNISECECEDGFQSNSIYDECTDINECDDVNSCDNKTSVTCNNTIGSYDCICKDGFAKDPSNHPKCIAINIPETKNIVGGVLGAIFGIIAVVAIALLIYYIVFKKNKTKHSKQQILQLNTDSTSIMPVYENSKINISELNKYFENHKKEINDQFNKCPKEFCYPKLASSLSENVSKNRFHKMYPYDHNRVKLNGTSDYINASFIKTYKNPPYLTFIAAQAPKKETCTDFWNMIWDNNVKIIIMLTKCVENNKEKCYQYWPDSDKETFDDFLIKKERNETRLNYITNRLIMTHNNEEKNVIHILYTSWMDKSIPDNVFSLLNLREKMISMIDKDSKNNILVHCSAGVGRTGTFIALDYLLRQAEREGCVDFYECMKFLRNQRCFMIQAPSQYEMCHRAMVMYHEIGRSTFIPLNNSTSLNFEELHKHFLNKQFHQIEKIVCNNKVKETNKFNDKFSSGQINAVYVPSSQKQSSYIVGVMPYKFLSEDLFHLFNKSSKHFILLDNQDLTFLPENHQQIQFRNGLLQLIEKEESDYFIKYSFRCDENRHNTYENFCNTENNPYANDLVNSTLFHITQDATTTYDLIVHLSSILKSNLDIKENGKIIILSRKGYEDAGFMIAALNILQMIDISKEIDIYETVFELRKIQPEICKSIDVYKNLHSFVDNYLKNIKK